MKYHQFDDVADAEAAMLAIGTDPRGAQIMREKAVFRVVHIPEVPLRAANILKQTCLAHGADAAVSRETAALTAKSTDVIIMATLAQYRKIVTALRRQPFGLSVLAEELDKFLWPNG